MDIHELLEAVKQGKIDITQAEETLKKLPYEEMGFAKLDHHRELRSGYGETIYCAGKAVEHLIQIFEAFKRQGGNVLGTRCTKKQYEEVHQVLPEIKYNELGRTLMLMQKEVEQRGRIAVCTGGTSDILVAEEAAQTAEFLGNKVERIYDVGVAGIHRLLSKRESLRHANCIIAIAGMEGALGGVVAGLVDKPVIAVPTSIGYGAHFNGIAPLLTMLNSCAEGMAVVNIDNGFGAAYMASQINRLAIGGTADE